MNYEYLTNRFNDDAIGIVVIYDDTNYGVISLNKKMRNFLIRKRIETTQDFMKLRNQIVFNNGSNANQNNIVVLNIVYFQ